MTPTKLFASALRRAIGLSAAAIILAAAPVSGIAAITCSSAPLPVPATNDGVYLNLVTGATGSTGSAATGWDINLYKSGSALYFYWPATPANSAGGVSTASVYDALAAGATIGSGQTYILNAAGGGPPSMVNWQTTQTGKYLGVRFYNESVSQINYGWLQLDTSASDVGFPATINQYCYDDSGATILAGDSGTDDTIFKNGFD